MASEMGCSSTVEIQYASKCSCILSEVPATQILVNECEHVMHNTIMMFLAWVPGKEICSDRTITKPAVERRCQEP